MPHQHLSNETLLKAHAEARALCDRIGLLINEPRPETFTIALSLARAQANLVDQLLSQSPPPAAPAGL